MGNNQIGKNGRLPFHSGTGMPSVWSCDSNNDFKLTNKQRLELREMAQRASVPQA